jgi:hypothetical protein
MALPKELEEMIALLPADDQATMRTLAEKNQVVREGYLRQADYDRRQNELKAEKAAAAEAQKKAEAEIKKNQDWFKENDARNNNNIAERNKFFNEATELRSKLENAERAVAAGGTGAADSKVIMDAVEERFKKAPYLSDAQARAIVAEETAKAVAAAREQFTTQTIPAIINYNYEISKIMLKHDKEFGEEFDRESFLKFVTEKNLENRAPQDVYAEWVAPRRNEAKEKKLVEDTEKRVRSERGVPGVGESREGLTPGSAPEDGAMVEFIKRSNANKTNGAGYGAAEAANALRAEGKI